MGRDVDAAALEHVGHDGGGRADGFLPDIDGGPGGESAETVMVDDFENLGLFDAFDGLGPFVVVDEDDLLALGLEHHAAVDDAFVASFLEDGVADVFGVDDLLFDILQQVGGVEGYDVAGHEEAHGNALVDHARRGIGVVGRGDDEAAVGFCCSLDGGGNGRVAREDETDTARLQQSELDIFPVPEDDEVAGGDVGGECGGLGGADFDFAVEKARGIAGDEGAFEGADDVFEGGFAVFEFADGVVLVVAFGEVSDGDDTDDGVIGVDDGDGFEVRVFDEEAAHVAQGFSGRDGGCVVEVDVLEGRIEIVDEPWFFEAETVEHVACFFVEFAGAGGLGVEAELPLEVGVGDGGAHGVRVGVAVADDPDGFVFVWHVGYLAINTCCCSLFCGGRSVLRAVRPG